MASWASVLLRRGGLHPNGVSPGRFYQRVFGTPLCTEPVQAAAARVITRFRLQGCPVDPHLGWVISYILPGGAIHRHRDAFEHYGVKTTARHLRCNVLVSGEPPSACPVIEGVPRSVAPGGLWAFYASEAHHETRPLEGDAPRIVYQFGFSVPPDYTLR